MSALLCLGLLSGVLGLVDPTGDVYLPGSPGDAASGVIPDLISGAAVFDGPGGELRFEFGFTESVVPASDFLDFDHQLHGFVDIDLDVPPINGNTSKKSEVSGFLSNLGIEAYIDLSTASGGLVGLCDPGGALISEVPISFAGSGVMITVPFSTLYGSGAPGTQVAYAAYFTDLFQGVADVFPNGDGFFVVPEPGTLSLFAVVCLAALRPRR